MAETVAIFGLGALPVVLLYQRSYAMYASPAVASMTGEMSVVDP